MDLILFRHGIAQNHGSDGSDHARRLTDEGRRLTTQAARGLCAMLDYVDLVLTSPKLRAMETAAIIAKAASYPREAAVTPTLAESSASQIASFLLSEYLGKAPHGVVIAVGHEPTLSQTAELLCTGSDDLNLFDMKNAGAVVISLPSGNSAATIPGRLKWCLPPEVLRQLAH